MSFLPMLAQSHAEIIPTLSLILVPAIKTAGEGKKKKKSGGTLWTKGASELVQLFIFQHVYPHHFLTQSDATLPKS